MSQIAENLKEVAEVAIKRGEDRQEFLNRALKAVAGLEDKDWDALTKETQDWFNSAADAKNAKAKTLPDFPDLKAEKAEEETTTRRRGAAKDDDKSTSGTVEVTKPKVGMAIKVITKRDKELSGHVVEVDDEVLVIKLGNGDEEELDRSRIKSMFSLADSGDADADDAGEEDPIKVGAKVVVLTKRGKEIKGEIVEVDDEILVVDTGDGEEELDRSRVESIKLAESKASSRRGTAKEEAPTKTTRRGAAKGDDKGDEKGTRTRSSNEGGVSVGGRIKELILDNLDASEAEIGKLLTTEGLEFRENTLKLNYSDAHKFLDLLKAKKMLKA